jgi:Domain of unknown function (DUF3854)
VKTQHMVPEPHEIQYPDLSEKHKRMLFSESGIAPKVVWERGYKSVEDPQELHELGFADYQCLTPGLLIPVRGLGKEVLFSRFRPDNPRLDRKGRPCKYEQPENTGITLDVPPSVQEKLQEVRQPLYICEGEKKADALASLGKVAVCIFGVNSWKRNDWLLPEWEYIPTIGRDIYLAFDSDSETNKSVKMALQALSEVLFYRSGETELRSKW